MLARILSFSAGLAWASAAQADVIEIGADGEVKTLERRSERELVVRANARASCRRPDDHPGFGADGRRPNAAGQGDYAQGARRRSRRPMRSAPICSKPWSGRRAAGTRRRGLGPVPSVWRN